MPALYPVDPTARRGVSIPLPDGTSFDTSGALAPDAAAMAQDAGIIPEFITDPLDRVRSEIAAWVDMLRQPAGNPAAARPAPGTNMATDPVDIERLNAEIVAGSPLPAVRDALNSPWNPLNHLSADTLRQNLGAFAAENPNLVDDSLARVRGALPLPDTAQMVPATTAQDFPHGKAPLPSVFEQTPAVDVGAINARMAADQDLARQKAAMSGSTQPGYMPPPGFDVSAYSRGFGGATTTPSETPLPHMPGALTDEQGAAITELEQERSRAAAARRAALADVLPQLIIPQGAEFDPITGRYNTPGGEPASVAGTGPGPFAAPPPSGGAFTGEDALPIPGRKPGPPSPAPQGALAADTGPVPTGQAPEAVPAGAASGGAGAPAATAGPAPGEDRGTTTRTGGGETTLMSDNGGFDPVKLFDQLSERFKDAEEDTSLTDAERRDLMVEAGLRMVQAASQPGAGAFGAAAAGGAAAMAGKRALVRDKKAMNLERSKQGIDLAETVTGLAMDAAKLDNERAKMGLDAAHDAAVLEETRRHNAASEQVSAALAQAAWVRANRMGEADRTEANNGYRLTLNTLYDRAFNAQISGLPPLAAHDEAGNALETEEEAIQRIAAFMNPESDGARSWAQGAIFRERKLQQDIMNDIELTSEQKTAEIEASKLRMAQLYADFLE